MCKLVEERNFLLQNNGNYDRINILNKLITEKYPRVILEDLKKINLIKNELEESKIENNLIREKFFD